MNGVCVERLGFGGKEIGSIGKTIPYIEDDGRVELIVWRLMAFL